MLMNEEVIDDIFSLTLEWKDNRLDFKFLKDDDARNVISRDMLKEIWYPKIQYLLPFENNLQ